MKNVYVKTQQAVDKVLCHDVTKIEKGGFKGALFKKGHVIREEDVEVLLNIGKQHIALIELEPGELHEEEAGLRIVNAIQGPGLFTKGPSEGRYDLIAATKGLLKVNGACLYRINRIPKVVVSTLHNHTPVEEGQKVAGAKVIPLVVREKTIQKVEAVASTSFPLLSVLPYRKIRVGAVITGREIYEARIADGFGSVLAQKTAFFGLEAPSVTYAVDDREKVCAAILDHLSKDCGLILVTGGMSVDPDDVTPASIKKTGAKIIKYGAPVLPGAMFMMAYREDVPIIGVPACAMYADTTILDLLLPRVLAGEIITASDIIRLGHGGLCRSCDKCIYPTCPFGKGSAS